jgi:hypothetical protein
MKENFSDSEKVYNYLNLILLEAAFVLVNKKHSIVV